MDKTALIKYIMALLLFGSNGIVASNIAMNSYEIVLLRTMIGSCFLIIAYILGKGKISFKNKKDVTYIVLSGMAMGASWMFLYEAYQQIGVSFASLLYYCGPVIVMILSPMIFRERLTRPKIIGFIVVIIGIVMVNGDIASEGDSTWGLFCGAMAAVTYFLMVTFNKKSRAIIGLENSVIQLVTSFITVAGFVGFRQGFVLDIPEGSLIWILILGIVNTGIGCYLYFSPLAKLPVQTVAVCGYLEPLSAVAFSAIILGETMTIVQIIGAAFIIGGAMIGELFRTKNDSQ